MQNLFKAEIDSAFIVDKQLLVVSMVSMVSYRYLIISLIRKSKRNKHGQVIISTIR
jgi:hypothetical protein